MKNTQWTGHLDNEWRPIGDTAPALKPGFYTLDPGGMFQPWCLKLRELKHDAIVSTGLAAAVTKDIDHFWASKADYTKFGMLHKRGVLMVGRPGIGKTMTAMLLCQHIISNGGIAVAVPNANLVALLAFALDAIREVHPEVPILNLMEDVETLFQKNPTGLLAILDGESQVNNVVHIATTNFPERLDARLVNRPGRFDSVVVVEPPDAAMRRDYLNKILPPTIANEKAIEELVTKSDGFLLSHMRELVAAVFVLNHPIDEAAETLRKMNATPIPTAASSKHKQAKALFGLANMIENIGYETVDQLDNDDEGN